MVDERRNPAVPLPWAVIALGLAVFAVAQLGFLTRPQGHLAAIWPTNAVLLGCLLRFPSLRSGTAWASAALGYLAADLTAGTPPIPMLWMTAGNLLGVAVGYVALSRVPHLLARPLGVLRLLTVCAAAALCAASVGALAISTLTDRDVGWGFIDWASSELMSYCLIVPVLLLLPARLPLERRQGRLPTAWRQWATHSLPAIAWLASIAAAYLVPTEWALALLLSSLLGCALTYRRATVATLSLLSTLWASLTPPFLMAQWLEPGAMTDASISATRLAVSLFGLLLLWLASLAEWRRTRRLETDHEPNALMRPDSFQQLADELLKRTQARNRPALLVLLQASPSMQECRPRLSLALRTGLRRGDISSWLEPSLCVMLLPLNRPENVANVVPRLENLINQTLLACDASGRFNQMTRMSTLLITPQEQTSLETLVTDAHHLLRPLPAVRRHVSAQPFRDHWRAPSGSGKTPAN